MKIKVKDLDQFEANSDITNQLVDLSPKSFRGVIRAAIRIRRGNRIVARASKELNQCSIL